MNLRPLPKRGEWTKLVYMNLRPLPKRGEWTKLVYLCFITQPHLNFIVYIAYWALFFSLFEKRKTFISSSCLGTSCTIFDLCFLWLHLVGIYVKNYQNTPRDLSDVALFTIHHENMPI